MSALDQSFAALAADNALLSVSVCHSRDEGAGLAPYFTVTLQWRDESKDFRRGCVACHDETIASALSRALAQMASERVASFADVPLTAEEMAELIAGDEAAERREAALEQRQRMAETTSELPARTGGLGA
jgi:DNA primase large subunit